MGHDCYLLIEGRFRTTPKNFSKTVNTVASRTAGFGCSKELVVIATPISEILGSGIPFEATLCFFKKAAENPEAQT